MGEFNLLDLKFILTQRWGMAFWEGISTYVMARGDFERGKDHSISHRAIFKKERFFKNFPKEKHLC